MQPVDSSPILDAGNGALESCIWSLFSVVVLFRLCFNRGVCVCMCLLFSGLELFSVRAWSDGFYSVRAGGRNILRGDFTDGGAIVKPPFPSWSPIVPFQALFSPVSVNVFLKQADSFRFLALLNRDRCEIVTRLRKEVLLKIKFSVPEYVSRSSFFWILEVIAWTALWNRLRRNCLELSIGV